MKEITIILLLLVPLVSFSQKESSALSIKEQRKERPAYIGITSGLSFSNFRDFATSPLTYNGSPLYLSLSHIKVDKNRESEFEFSYAFGIYTKIFNFQFNASQVKTTSLYYSQLYRLNKLSSEQFNVKIGGQFNISRNIRVNESLWNNSVGAEVFPNLSGSIKIIKDISRKEDKDKRFLFLKYTLNQRTRNLAFRLNIGLINSSYRNGFAYTRQTIDLNGLNLYEGYQFKIFSGFRMSSSLDYTISLKNKNAFQLSYFWDAYKTGGNLDKFEMASHIFKFTFLFNTNNK